MDQDRVEKEVERLGAVLVPYLCERTGVSKQDVIAVMDALDKFWEEQPHVVGRMFVFGFEADLDEGDEGEHA